MGKRRRAYPPHPRNREPGRCNAGQRRELPHQEVVHVAGNSPSRKPGEGMPQLHRRRPRHELRARRVDDLLAGPSTGGLHRHPGLQLRRSPSCGLPVGDGSQGTRCENHPRGPSLLPDECPGRYLRADPRRHRYRIPWRFDQLGAHPRGVLPRVCCQLHERGHDPAGRFPGHGRARWPVLRVQPLGAVLRPRELAVRGRQRCGFVR